MTDLRGELLRRGELDRRAMLGMSGRRVDPAMAERSGAVTRDNAEWLRGVLHQWGWPGWALVGRDGAEAAWLIAQHADCDPAFQRECLDLLAAAVAGDDADKRHLAYLTDRVLVNEGGRQRYGTQLLEPIEDPRGVGRRRSEMGLPPLAAYRTLVVLFGGVSIVSAAARGAADAVRRRRGASRR